MTEKDTYSIVLRDHESDNLVFIAEVRTQGDIERIKQTNIKESPNKW